MHPSWVNGERRSISIGQKALAHALIYPEAARLKRKKSGSVDLQNAARRSIRRKVWEHKPLHRVCLKRAR
jgi:hypothetical protein